MQPRPDHGPVRTAGSDRNRGQKTEPWTGFPVFEPEPKPEPVKIRFRFGPRNSEPWTEPEPDKKKFQIFLTEPDRNRTGTWTGTDRFSQQIFKFFWPLGKRSNDHFAPNGHITVLCFKKSKKNPNFFFHFFSSYKYPLSFLILIHTILSQFS